MRKKTTPTSIRFDIEKLALVKERERLVTGQQVVDFLLNKYWWDNKLPNPTWKESPPLELREASLITPDQKATVKSDNNEDQQITLTSEAAFMERLATVKNMNEIKKIVQEVEKSGLTFFPKQRVKDFALKVSENFYQD